MLNEKNINLLYTTNYIVCKLYARCRGIFTRKHQISILNSSRKNNPLPVAGGHTHGYTVKYFENQLVQELLSYKRFKLCISNKILVSLLKEFLRFLYYTLSVQEYLSSIHSLNICLISQIVSTCVMHCLLFHYNLLFSCNFKALFQVYLGFSLVGTLLNLN